MLAVLAVIAVGGLGLIALTRDSGSDDTTTQPPTTDEPPPDDPPDTAPPTTDEPTEPTEPDDGPSAVRFGGYVNEPEDLGDDLVLHEYGFSTVESFLDLHDHLLPTIGLVIENQGSELRSRLNLSFDAFDENDQLLTTGDIRLGMIQPGETLYVGHLVQDGSTAYGEPVDAPVDRLEIRYGGEDLGSQLGTGSTDVSDITVEPGRNGSFTARFRASSSYGTDLDLARTNVVIRNRDGEIVGGTSLSFQGHVPADGDTASEIQVQADFDGLDVDFDNLGISIDPGLVHD